MLKTDIIESEKEVRFVLHGKLFEPWVSGLKIIWGDKRVSFANRTVVVDLREMTAVDRNGMDLLSQMQEYGARFLTAGVHTKFLVESLRKKRGKNGTEAMQL